MSRPRIASTASDDELQGARRWLVLSGELAGALLLAPFALLVLVPVMAIGGLLRAVGGGLVRFDVLPRRRGLEVDAEGIALSWSGVEGDSEAALADGIDLLLETARRCADVRSLRTIGLVEAAGTPEGSVPALEGSLGAALAPRLAGRRIAYGALIVNDGELRLALEVDARSDRAGHLAVELPADRWLPWARVLLDLAPAWGFKVRTAGLQLPGDEVDSAAA